MKINLVTIIQKPTLWISSFTRLVTVSVLSCLFLICAPTQAQQTIQWETKLDQAQQLAKQHDKLVLLHFTAPWSLPCRNLANFVHSESRVRSAFRDNVIAVKIDVDQHPELVEQYKVPSVPFEVVLTADKKIVSKRKSPDNSSAYYKMVTEWAVLLNDSSKVNHAMADLQSLDAPNNQQFQSHKTSFSPSAPSHLPPATSPESARLKRRSENSFFAKPDSIGTASTTGLNQPAVNENITPVQDSDSAREAKPIRPNTFGTALPNHQVPEKSSAFSGPNYKKLATKNQDQGFIQVPTGQVKKNPFFTPSAKQTEPLARNTDKPKAERINPPDLPKFKLPVSQPTPPTIESKFAIKPKPSPPVINKRPAVNPKQPNNDFRVPNPPQIANRPPAKTVKPNTNSFKPKLENQFQPSKATLKSPAISPKQLLADSTNSVKKAGKNQSNGVTTANYALRGKCPVSLLTQGKWINGNPQWGCVHRNQVYIFSSEVNLNRFKDNPEAFSPILAGFDPVVFHETGKLTTGLLNHGVFMGEAPNQRIILFSDTQTRTRFQKSPKQFLETVRQAMEQTDSMNHFRR